jgi:membrane dipeptidase
MPEAVGDVAGLPAVLDALRDAGFADAELEQVAWRNWRRVLNATWSA